MPDPTLVDALASLGALGLAIVAVIAFVRGDVVTRRELESRLAERTQADVELVAEVRMDRDEWKGVAKTAVEGLERIGDLLDGALGERR